MGSESGALLHATRFEDLIAAHLRSMRIAFIDEAALKGSGATCTPELRAEFTVVHQWRDGDLD